MMHLLNTARRWLWAFKLRLVCAELPDVYDDMSDALEADDFSLYCALADFHSELMAEAKSLCEKLATTER